MRYTVLSSIIFSGLTGLGAAEAHPGGLNAEGCHNNRKTGEYHCHRGTTASSSTRQRSFLTGSGGVLFGIALPHVRPAPRQSWLGNLVTGLTWIGMEMELLVNRTAGGEKFCRVTARSNTSISMAWG